MDQSEMMALIRAGVPAVPGIWADLGAGTGNFTRALATLLRPPSTIYAIDRDARAVASQQHASGAAPGIAILPRQADITRPLELPALDGLLMANVLHFLRTPALGQLASYLSPSGRMLIVEYAVEQPQLWIPFPVPLTRLVQLATAAGLPRPQLIGQRRSPSSGISMYAATIQPAAPA